ncbi:hypothetical protein DQ04_16671000 [Trypanosoma grayi]|uniref:hypothetical protein n=1 Tax=Trypanosoma grayi TaxID=71804 RepID=UPI0004F460A0|nr:hypothetical protein DQ04_16671000 [Trypanosoma grayi]KEG06001.1 hypothetical protein DQ04_16671000 [Trypanosoma grayi]
MPGMVAEAALEPCDWPDAARLVCLVVDELVLEATDTTVTGVEVPLHWSARESFSATEVGLPSLFTFWQWSRVERSVRFAECTGTRVSPFPYYGNLVAAAEVWCWAG